MRMGILAAGTGERLARGGVSIPKPLLPIGGKPLIARIIESAARIGLSSVACIVNDLTPATAGYLRSRPWPVPVDVLVKTTPSSMESLFALRPFLEKGPFLLSTVDVVFGLDTLASFYRRVPELTDASGILALTRFIDDEKPLHAAVDGKGRVTTLGEDASRSEFITAGFYAFRPEIFSLIEEARARRLTAFRQFLGLLVESGYRVYGVPVSKTVDVDYPEDIRKAEAFLEEIGGR
ncbi:MAG: NTP transferase domain-containing protein [Syntrophobacteraceae bacterium]|nr:NTP transferase domain-containing protein [Syntrophobacteraceae bacterium]